MKNLYTILFITIVFISCKSVDNKAEITYFGGQIINPKSNFITLMKGEKALDTIYLSKNNTFSTQLDYIKEGLYSFRHGSENLGYEYQYIYFEPKDSIIIRLNTWDFDESLVYSGKGAEKNNFLLTLYLQNEKEGKSFSPYYNLKPKEFLNKTATIESLNQHLYDQLKESKVKLSPKFNELAKVAVSFPIYLRKEIYPFRHKNRFQLDYLPALPSNYYDYRKNININNQDLIDFAPYHNYVNNYLNSLVYNKCDGKTNITKDILNTIVDKITVEELKNRLLFQAIYSDFRNSRYSCCINQTALDIFNDNCTDKEFLHQVNSLAEDCENNKDQSPLKDFEIITHKNSKTNIKSVIKNKKSVVYFWSPEKMSAEMLIKRVNYLKKNYPTIQFVGINMKPSKKGSRAHQFLNNQFILSQESAGNRLIKSKEPRTILVDKNGIITNSFTYLSSPYLEKQLAELENK